MNYIEKIKNAMEDKESGIASFKSSENMLNEMVIVIVGHFSLPTILENMIKSKEIEIRDYHILFDDRLKVKLWICEYGNREK